MASSRLQGFRLAAHMFVFRSLKYAYHCILTVVFCWKVWRIWQLSRSLSHLWTAVRIGWPVHRQPTFVGPQSYNFQKFKQSIAERCSGFQQLSFFLWLKISKWLCWDKDACFCLIVRKLQRLQKLSENHRPLITYHWYLCTIPANAKKVAQVWSSWRGSVTGDVVD